jgi:aspartate/methionine/tyrosine aminotransferase
MQSMFSSRLKWSSPANRPSLAAARQRASGVRLLDLTASNPTAEGFRYPDEAISRALGNHASLRYQPEPLGLRAAREAVSRYYGGRVPVERLVLTASTSEAYAFLFKLLCDPGDEILTPRPSYPLFDYLARLESVDVRHYPLFYDHGWHIDGERLRLATTKRTRAVVVVNPNNPTGSLITGTDYDYLVSHCDEHGLALISDEVFSDYMLAPREGGVRSLARESQALTFILGGLSKLAGLPQMKLGWIAVLGPPPLADAALSRLEMIADTFLSVSTPIQLAAPALIAAGQDVRRQIQRRTLRNLDALRSALSGSAFRGLEPEGGWYAVVQAPRFCSEEEWVVGLIEHKHVLVQPGYFYDFETEPFLVLSLLTREDVFDEGVRRLIAYSDILQASC